MRYLSAILLAAACGSSVNHISNPMPAPGGGVGGGGVEGELNVFVVDSTTEAPLSGASVIVHTAALAMPLTGTTDATGLATFKSDSLKGGQDVTATSDAHVAATFLGADGAVVTIPLEATSQTNPTVDTATVAGTIANFCDTTPALGHATLATVQYSNVLPVGDPRNGIQQGGGTIPANACFNSLAGCQCNWTLNTRTGLQMIYAIIGDYDTSTQALTVTGYAFLANQTFSKGDSKTGVTLTPVDSAHVKTVPVSFSNIPAGLDTVNGVVGVDLGDQGVVGADLIADSTVTSLTLPTLSDDLASGKYLAFLNAQDSATQGIPSSAILNDAIDASGTIMFSSWLALPQNIAGAAGARTFAFGAVAGAKVHTIAITDGAGANVWNLVILDARSSFTFPTLTNDPLAVTGLVGTVTAIDGPFDPGNFNVDDVKKTATRIAVNQAAFAP